MTKMLIASISQTANFQCYHDYAMDDNAGATVSLKLRESLIGFEGLCGISISIKFVKI